MGSCLRDKIEVISKFMVHTNFERSYLLLWKLRPCKKPRLLGVLKTQTPEKLTPLALRHLKVWVFRGTGFWVFITPPTRSGVFRQRETNNHIRLNLHTKLNYLKGIVETYACKKSLLLPVKSINHYTLMKTTMHFFSITTMCPIEGK